MLSLYPMKMIVPTSNMVSTRTLEEISVTTDCDPLQPKRKDKMKLSEWHNNLLVLFASALCTSQARRLAARLFSYKQLRQLHRLAQRHQVSYQVWHLRSNMA
jgi:hypothetical protein